MQTKIVLRSNRFFGFFSASYLSECFISAALLMGFVTATFAVLSQEAARENCRMTIGKPIVHACMMALGGRKAPGAEANLASCRAKATPQVRACVMAALNAANSRANVAIEVPKESALSVAGGIGLPAGFVAPPRTIADITAILDSEKPDVKKIDELKEDAASKPTGKESRADLAQFYFDRGNARAQLGRLTESLADANKAIEVGKGAVGTNLMGRLLQLAAIQYSAAGDPKKALEVNQRMMREIVSAPGGKGWMFGVNRSMANLLVQMGDVAQAEATLRRTLPLLQEARTSGHPNWRASYAKLGQNWEAEVELGRATIFEARGQFRDAEASYRLAEQRKRGGMKGVMDTDDPPAETVLLQAVD